MGVWEIRGAFYQTERDENQTTLLLNKMQKEKQKQNEKMRKEVKDSGRKVVSENENVSNEEWLCQSVGKESLEEEWKEEEVEEEERESEGKGKGTSVPLSTNEGNSLAKI